MHTTVISDTAFLHDGDYGGTIEIVASDGARLAIPAEDLKGFVASWSRHERAIELEEMLYGTGEGEPVAVIHSTDVKTTTYTDGRWQIVSRDDPARCTIEWISDSGEPVKFATVFGGADQHDYAWEEALATLERLKAGGEDIKS